VAVGWSNSGVEEDIHPESERLLVGKETNLIRPALVFRCVTASPCPGTSLKRFESDQLRLWPFQSDTYSAPAVEGGAGFDVAPSPLTDIRATKPMQSIRSNLGLLMAGSYGLVTAVVLYLSFMAPQSLPPHLAAILLTLPWSIVVVFLGFLLIHLSSHGMDYGFMVGAVLNTLLLFALGRKLAKAIESREKVN
jgi:hypothetical protein